MQLNDLKEILDRGLLEQDQFDFLHRITSRQIISLFYEIRTVLSVGVLLFTTGVGILIYKHTGKIGHTVNLALLSGLMAACFWYASKHHRPFSRAEVASPTPYYDYVLLLGALLFVTIEGYLQTLYSIFGHQWGLAALIPAVLFFILAYLYDHRGILALAITATASAIGLELSAANWLRNNVFSQEALIAPAIALGAGFIALGFALNGIRLKKHFTFIYLLWGITLLLTGLLAALIAFEPKGFYSLVLVTASIAAIAYALRTRTFVFYLYGAIFGYIGLTVLIALQVELNGGFWYLYFLLSCGGLLYFIQRSLRSFRKG